MIRVSPFLLLLILIGAAGSAGAQDALLLHYSFDDGRGTTAADTSGNRLNGVVSAAWVDSPSGKALFFDGTPSHVVSVQIPAGQRFGKGSWTFSAWLKPTRFTIDDRQNQRRIFSFGAFPDANLVIDLLASGKISYYFCYRRGGTNRIVSTGGSSAAALKTGQWAHVAVVCDRKAGQVEIYIDGFSQGETALPTGFAGDFSLNGDLTLGSPWHNYWGVMDEARVYRRALSRAEVKAEFSRLQKTFGVTLSPEMAAAEKQEALMESFAKSHDAWAAGNFAAVRAACDAVIGSKAAPVSLRSYAELRRAQSYAAQGKRDLAELEYARIAANPAYPEVHRAEARERIAELARVARGLPARDPAASRTVIPPITHFAAQLFVSPRGSDANNGSKAAPVAGLARARDLVRALKRKGVRGAIEINVQPGEYSVTAPLALTAEDSGTPDAPVVYRSVQPGKAVFYGGRRIMGFRTVTDPAILDRLPETARGRVLYCDLRAQGITDYGQLAVRGFGQPPSPPTLELFVNGKPMTLARWPNKGFVGIDKLVDPGSRAAGKPSVFEYLGDRPARWTKAKDAWLFGYFRYLWADGTIKIAKIDPGAHTITTAEAYQYGPPGMDNGQGIQYYAFNLLEEIDQPGEWYLDRETGLLYLYPPTDLAKATVEIGMLSTPMVTMDHVTDVRMEGLKFDLSRYNGLVLTDCSRCLVAGCTVSRMAGDGISIDGGEADGILGCDIFCIGRRATEVIGGDRETLTPGRHFVENCRIYDFGRIDRTYTPAIQLEGVGNRVAHNMMYDCPSSVMRIEGNDHVIEYNEVFNAVQESDDQGAMELFGNPTYRGVVFRYNRFTNCGKTGAEKEVVGQAAIRFDDAISGMTVYGNVFINSANGHFGAVQMNSGRDNIMDNNLFIDCKQGISGGWNAGNGVWRTVASGNLPPEFIENALYLKRYPEIANMLKEPGINHVWRNVFYRCGPMVTGDRANLDLVENGVFDKDPGFVDAAKGDYHLKPNAALFADVGFDPIPLDEIGLYKDQYRARVEIPPGLVPEGRVKAH
ncbi:MAG TPA: LamG-like jellyroll fold domain-containing protein [Armatimonadota bacterium]|nr:LamG-like jellyroll fold domain-containing protein [Armatimonadota bacterium]